MNSLRFCSNADSAPLDLGWDQGFYSFPKLPSDADAEHPEYHARSNKNLEHLYAKCLTEQTEQETRIPWGRDSCRAWHTGSCWQDRESLETEQERESTSRRER